MSSVLIVVVVIIAWGGVVALMLRGWRNRGRRQTELIGAFPDVPSDPGEVLVGPDTGVYVGSTIAPSWQDRVAVGDYGDRAAAEFTAFTGGILISRHGANPIWIPADAVLAIRTERGLAGKVMTADGVLVIRWTLPSGTGIDSGLRGDDKTRYLDWTARDPRRSDSPTGSDASRTDTTHPDSAHPDTTHADTPRADPEGGAS